MEIQESTMLAKSKTNVIYILFIIFALYCIASNLSLRHPSDDDYFLRHFNNSSLVDFITMRYNTWSGRWSIEAITILTIGYDIFWKLLVPACVLLLSHSIAAIVFERASLDKIVIAMALTISMPAVISKDSLFWVTGFYNYLLPASLALYSFKCFKNETGSTQRALAIPSLLVACNNEQVGLAMVSASLFFLAFSGKKITCYRVIYLLTSIGSFLLLILAPGNYLRSAIEQSNRMPEFSQLSFLQKILMGLDRLNGFFVNGFHVVILALSLILALYMYNMKCKKITDYLSLAIITYCAVAILSKSCGINVNTLLFGDIRYVAFNTISQVVKFALCLMFIFSLCYASVRSGGEDGLKGATCIVIACLTIVAIGLSPTSYASSYRVLFVAEVLLIVGVCYVAKSTLISEFAVKSFSFILMVLAMTSLAS